jgi:ribosomal protein L19E
VVVNLKAKKRLAARVTGVGVHRIKFDSDHLDDVADAITRTLSKLDHLLELPEEGHKTRKTKKTREEQNKAPNKVGKELVLERKRSTLQRSVH